MVHAVRADGTGPGSRKISLLTTGFDGNFKSESSHYLFTLFLFCVSRIMNQFARSSNSINQKSLRNVSPDITIKIADQCVMRASMLTSKSSRHVSLTYAG